MRKPKITPTVRDQIDEKIIQAPPLVPELPPGHYAVQMPFPGIVRDPFKPKKVAIVGTQPASRMKAPFNDPEWTIWACSPGNQGVIPRVDIWFEMHASLLWDSNKVYGEPWLKWLNEQPAPVVAIDQSQIKRAVPYPFEMMVRLFGPYVWTSTFSYMMALAIATPGLEEMALYGVDMASEGEYRDQRAGGQFLIWEAWKAGIKVTVPPESDLLNPPPFYGYYDATREGVKTATRKQEIQARIDEVERDINAKQGTLIYLKGAREDRDYHEKCGSVAQLERIMPLLEPQLKGWQEARAKQCLTSSAAIPGSSMPLTGLQFTPISGVSMATTLASS